MKKNNTRGFMMVETLIVASFIAIILVYLFVQFRNINNNYSKTLRYNGVNELYLLNQIKEYLKNSNLEQLSTGINEGQRSYYILSYCDSNIFDNSEYCQNLFSMANIVTAVYMDSNNIVTSTDFSSDFNDFLKTIKAEGNMHVIAAQFSDSSFASLHIKDSAYQSSDSY